jgi:hypothetical protein
MQEPAFKQVAANYGIRLEYRNAQEYSAFAKKAFAEEGHRQSDRTGLMIPAGCWVVRSALPGGRRVGIRCRIARPCSEGLPNPQDIACCYSVAHCSKVHGLLAAHSGLPLAPYGKRSKAHRIRR